MKVTYMFIFLSFFSACKKFTEVPPPSTTLVQSNVFSTDATAIGALTGLLTQMSNNQSFGSGSFATGQLSVAVSAGLSADELTLWSGQSNSSLVGYYQNNLSAANTSLYSDLWPQLFSFIFQANSAIEGLTGTNSSSLTTATKQQLLGEAKFLRAFYYFYLTNVYGDVPLITTTDYTITAKLSRAPQSAVYQQIIADLKDAQTLLSPNYLDSRLLKYTGTPERVRPTSWAASSLLARVYLYTSDYSGAAIQATAVINNSAQFSLTSLNSTFLANSPEAIWQLQPVGANNVINTLDGYYFTVPSTGFDDDRSFYLNPTLISSFESGDGRFAKWVGVYGSGSSAVYYPYKYKQSAIGTGSAQTEYLMVLRLAEQYLIRAEAEANLNQTGPAISDLNTIRTRAGLLNTTATTQATLLTAIQHERQVELFSEWGHRWFDLKRTGTIDPVMSIQTPLKGGTWSSYKALFPILNDDIKADPSLVQNPGY